jgi:phenylacetate-CoA ligase
MGADVTAAEAYPREAGLYGLLMRSQWFSAREIADIQAQGLEELVRHARATVPFYQTRLAPLFTRRGAFDMAGWDQVPPLSRAELRDNFEALRTTGPALPRDGLKTVETSGSTAEPVRATLTELQRNASRAAGARFGAWHGIDYSLAYAAIRSYPAGVAMAPGGDIRAEFWGPYWLDVPVKGAWHRLSITSGPKDQIAWLSKIGPCYLNTFPANLRNVLASARR